MQNKDHKQVEVLVAYTMQEVWEAIKKTNKAVQANTSAGADYIAFIRIGLKDENGRRLPGIITHIAKVKETIFDKPLAELFKEAPEFAEIHKEKGWEGNCNEYQLEKIEELPNPIPHKKGDSARSQVKFYTTMDEIRNAKVISDIKTLSQLKQ